MLALVRLSLIVGSGAVGCWQEIKAPTYKENNDEKSPNFGNFNIYGNEHALRLYH